MPITAFALGTWQVYRRKWKLSLIDEVSEKLSQPPLTSLSQILNVSGDSDAIPVKLNGKFLHDKEILVGPRQHNGQTGYHVITPLCENERNCILVNRGWISKDFAAQSTRPPAQSRSTISGLLRRKPAHNVFTPANNYEKGQYYYVDINEMSQQAGVLPVLVEATVDPKQSTEDWEKLGYPVGKPHEVTLVNNHMQYIITWYALAAATGIMSLSLFRKKSARFGAPKGHNT